VTENDFTYGKQIDAPNDWPEIICKAIADQHFEYMLILRNGLVIKFEGAAKSREGWVTLKNPQTLEGNKLLNCSFERGLEIRVSDIIAIADAPQGS
jgi:hypothetical protein